MSRSTEDRLLNMILAGGAARGRATLELWRLTHKANRRVVQKNKGNKEDLEDLVTGATEALYVFFDKGKKLRYQTDSCLVAYFKGIVFNMGTGGQSSKELLLGEFEEDIADLDESIEEMISQAEEQNSMYSKLEDCLKKLDEKCQKIIKWRYFDEPQVQWTDIAKRLGYVEQSARNQGGRCMRRLRQCMGA